MEQKKKLDVSAPGNVDMFAPFETIETANRRSKICEWNRKTDVSALIKGSPVCTIWND